MLVAVDVTCLEREGLGPSWTVVNISSVYIHFRTLLGCTAVLWWWAPLLGCDFCGHIVLTDKSNPMAPGRFRTPLHCFGKSAVWS